MIVMASTHRILPSAACGVRPHCAEMVRIFVRQTVRKLREATRPASMIVAGQSSAIEGIRTIFKRRAKASGTRVKSNHKKS
jgi:hypothetical protein